MTIATYGVREAKARFSEILRGLEVGDEAIITRHGKPWGRIIPIEAPASDQPPLRMRRGALADVLPDATWDDFMEAKRIWEPRMSDFVGDDDDAR